MKTKKILSLILALCMVMSVISVGILSAAAAENEDPADVAVDATEAPTEAETEVQTEPETEVATEAATEAEKVVDAKWEFGWTTNFDFSSDGDVYIVSAMNKAKESKNFDYSVVQPLATKDVSGTKRKDYVFLCYRVNNDKREINLFGYQPSWEVVTVRYSKASDSYLRDGSEEIDIANVKTTDNPSHAWNISSPKTPSAEVYSELPESVASALQNYEDIKLDMIAQLGTQKYVGTNHRFLCYGTKDSKTELYVVDVNEMGYNAEVTNISLFDLNAYLPTSTTVDYINDLADKTEEIKASNADAQQSGSNGVKSGSSGGTTSVTSTGSSSGSASSSTSPKTGQSETVAFIMLGVLLLSAGVIFFVRKRERT